MEQNQDNPSVTIILTEKQKRKIRSWAGCVVSTVLVSAYSDSSMYPVGNEKPPRNTIPIKLEPDQIRKIEECFSKQGLTGKEIVVLDPHDEEGDCEPNMVAAVLRKYVPPPPRVSSSTRSYSSDYEPGDTCSCCQDP